MTFEEMWRKRGYLLDDACLVEEVEEFFNAGLAEGLRRAEMLASNAVERCREYNCGSFAVSASKAIADAIRREREGLK